MLYLAEVQKQKGGLLSGGSKTELKLLACQRTDQNWSTVSEDVITAEEANKLNDGALVLVEMNPNRQVQRIQEAGRPLVNILQNFSRQLEKFKLKEDEIDQWKQSLTFQAQEMNRREMEMEVRLEQLQQMEDDRQRLEEQKQEFDSSREEIEKLKAEIERNSQELEGAWEHLRGEQRRLEERQAELAQGNVLDEEQSRVMSELLNRLPSRVAPTETVREHLHQAFELIEQQQATLNPYWEQLEQQKTLATQQQEEIERLAQTLSDRQNELHQAQSSLEQQNTQLKVNVATITSKQEYAQLVKEQLQYQEDLYQKINFLSANSVNSSSQKIDIEALERMPLDELQKIVQDLINKLDIDSNFVHEQEQELQYKQESIKELETKLSQASDQDHINLEMELADEKDHYQMLNKTLEGQRRSLLQRQNLIKQHQNILLSRQGQPITFTEEVSQVDFAPILSQINSQRQQQSQELQKIEQEIEQMKSATEIEQKMVENQTHDLEQKQQELKTLEANLESLRTATAECWSRVNLFQNTLQPIQDSLNGLRQKLQGISETLAQVQETGDYQLQTISEMRQALQNLISQPELVAS